MGARTVQRQVTFAPSAMAIRPAREDERYVMTRFQEHASHCSKCVDPLEVYLNGGTLCDRGHDYARDVAQYIYSKGGKAYSIVDRQSTREKIQVEIPSNCGAIRNLCKAVDKGLTVRREKAIVSHDPNYYVPDRPRPTERVQRDDYEVVTIKPANSREEKRRHDGREKSEKKRSPVYVQGRGSLYEKDEADRRSRQRYDSQPIIIDAAPRRR